MRSPGSFASTTIHVHSLDTHLYIYIYIYIYWEGGRRGEGGTDGGGERGRESARDRGSEGRQGGYVLQMEEGIDGGIIYDFMKKSSSLAIMRMCKDRII